ncbi:MAG: hypothetical protein HYR84_14090, partial [Planctomycetes bacterium]|nr:hypothetical protein [Planctomycetota bacterium]
MILIRRMFAGLLVLGGLGIMSLAASSYAQGQDQPDKKAKEADPKVVEPKLPLAHIGPRQVDWNERKYAFEMSGKAWPDVFRWLCEESKLVYSSSYKPPTGGITYITPKGQKYSLLEVFDIINRRLQTQEKYTLIRGDIDLSLFPADVEIPGILIPRLRVDNKVNELDSRGQTEIVEVMVKLKDQFIAEDIAADVKRFLGDFGKVTPISSTNSLLMRADVAALRRWIPYLMHTGEKDDTSAHTHHHKCKFIRATTAEVVLVKALGQSRQIVQIETKGGTPTADGGGGKGPGFGPGGGGAGRRIVREIIVTSEKASNTVIINGPSDRIGQAKAILAGLDVPRYPGDTGLMPTGPHTFVDHDVPGGGADVMDKLLKEIYRSDDSIRIMVANPARLFVWADPQTHFEIKAIMQPLKPALVDTAVFALSRLDAGKLAVSLKEMITGAKNNSPFIEADTEQNTIRARGTPDELKTVRDIIRILDGDGAAGDGTKRMIILEKGSGATIAEALSLVFGKMRDNKVELVLPGQLDDLLRPDFRPPEKKIEPKFEFKPPQKTSRITPDMVREAIYLDNPRRESPVFFQGQEEKKANLPPIRIMGFGNRIIISSDDPKALDVAHDIIRVLVNTEAGPGDIEVLRLRLANAVEVAKILDEAFNGPKTQQGGGRGGPPGGGGLGGLPGMVLGGVMGLGGGGQNTRVENIRVVADAATNSLLVRAKPADMLTIRRLLDKYIDVRDPNSEVTVKTHHIHLKNSNALEVADLIKSVFAESMKTAPTSQGGGGSPFGIFGGPRPVDSSGMDKKVLLTIAADNHTNSIYVACPTTLYKEIKQLVDEIENVSSQSKQITKIVSIKDIDPITLQNALDAFSGRSTAQRRPGDTGVNPTTFAPGGFGTPMRFGFGGGGTGFQGGGGGAMPIFMPSFPGGGGGGPTPGTGGGGPRPGGGGKGAKGGASLDRGPDFFVSRVMDDPSVRVFYDPAEEQQEPLRIDPLRDNFMKLPGYSINPLQLTVHQAGDAPPAPKITSGTVTLHDITKTPQIGTWSVKDGTITLSFPRAVYIGKLSGSEMSGDARDEKLKWTWSASRYAGTNDWLGKEDRPGFGQLMFRFGSVGPGGSPDELTPPRLGVDIQVLPDLGIAILKTYNEQDLRAILQIIEMIRRESQPALIDVELVPVRFGDPFEITATLNQLYSSVIIQPFSQSFNPQTTTRPGGAPAPAPAPGGGPTPTPTPAAPAATSAAVPRNIVLIPQPKLSAILVAAAKSRMPDIKAQIHKLDQRPSDPSHAVYRPLRRASAARVAASLNTFYAGRFLAPGNVNQIRITWDDGSNTIIVQASPADLEEINRLIDYIDNARNKAENEIRVIPLRAAVAADLSLLLNQSIANGVLTLNTVTGIPGLQQQPPQPIAGQLGAIPQIPATKEISLVLIGKDGKNIEARVLEDIRVNADIRTNSLVISAPPESMQLVLSLIRELDVAPLSRSEINIFHLRKSDATQMALMLQQLFLGTGQVGARAGGAPAGGGAAGAQTRPPASFVINATTEPGSPIIDLRVTVDERTNSLVVAGSKSDLLIVESIIGKIEDANIPERRSRAVRLRNSQAADVANAVTDFITKTQALIKGYNQETNSLGLMRDIVVVAEPISNSVLINATPEAFAMILDVIASIDTPPPQVVIQVVIAEVTTNGSEEFGMELGLQTPVIFNRGTVTGAAAAAGASYATFSPGYDFTNPSLAPGNNVLANPQAVGFQALTSAGVGRRSPTSGIGGLVLSAGSDTVNVLIRALRTQGRINVLSRPQVMTLDNQTALVQLGAKIPYVSGAPTITTAG